jgi:hypothetical protein
MLGDACREGFEPLRAEVALSVPAHRDRPLLDLAVAHHEHVRDLLQLGLADAAADRLRPGVELGAHAQRLQRVAGRGGRLGVAVGDRQHDALHRRQPDRELAAVVLDQQADEALERAEDRAVDHRRPVQRVVLAGVLEAEALGEVEVELHRAELP